MAQRDRVAVPADGGAVPGAEGPRGEDSAKTTGLVVDAYFSGTKIEWVLDNVEGRGKGRQWRFAFGNIDSWLSGT